MLEGVDEHNHIPDTWCFVRHRDVATINPKMSKDIFDDDYLVSFIPMSAVEECSGRYDYSETRPYGEVKKGYTPFISGDLIFAKITPCMENGKVALLKDLHNDVGCGSTEFHVSRLSELVNKKYFFYFLVQQRTRRNAQVHMTGSAGQLRVPKAYFEELEIPLPPLAEQHWIVEKIEELFSDLDDGIASLKRAQQQLKVYRQAVLKWAFEGKLTAQWREEQQRQGKLESAETLLAQIKAERERRYQAKLAQWQADVAAWEANGKAGKKPRKPGKANNFLTIDDKERKKLADLPYGWFWSRLGNISSKIQIGPFGSLLHKSDYVTGQIPAINPTHIHGLKIHPDSGFTITSEKFNELRKYALEIGDIIMGRRGEMGRCALVTDKENGFLCGTGSLYIRLIKSLNGSFYSYFLSSRGTRTYLENNSIGTTMKNLNEDVLNSVPVVVCSPLEQNQIVEEIESRLSICDSLETTITENLERAEALRQSILKRAFEGKLVPQDPNDEPASVLLERIHASKSPPRRG